MLGKSKKIKASELLLKLREAVIKLVDQVKDIKTNLDGLNMRVSNLEKRLVALENKIKGLSGGVSKPVVKQPSAEKESQLDLLAKELGLDISLGGGTETSEVPAPPPPPSIESIKSDTKSTKGIELPIEKPKPPTTPAPEPIKSEELLGMEAIDRDELDKDKDDLLKALRELDEL